MTDAQQYYLDVLVTPVDPDEPNCKGRTATSFGAGYVNCRWPDGKVYTHWYSQLWSTPYGRPA